MAFPDDPTDLTIEMQIGDTWIDLVDGDYVLDRGISITRGRADEAGQIEPQKLSLTLDNAGGRFSPRNPTSPYYGVLGRNTPVRAYVARGDNYLELPDTTDYISCPDATGLGITGDIDVRVDVTTSYWSATYLAGKYKTASDQRSWAFVVSPEGLLSFIWTTAGTSASADLVQSSIPVPLQPGRKALRVVLDVSATSATFYTADTISGTWTQLGDVVTSVLGTGTSIYDSTAPIELGDVTDHPTIVQQSYTGLVGRFNAFELRNSSGTVVANPTFTGLTAGASSVADSHSNTFTFQNDAAVSNKRWRFHGELSSLPPRWDTSGNDTYVPIDVNGMLRRLRQANTPLHSALYRQLANGPNPVAAYWSCEDDSSATSFAPATPYTSPGKFAGSLSLSATSVNGSDSLPTTNNTNVTFSVPEYDASNGSVAFFFLYIPSDSKPADGTVLASINTTGSASRWEFVYWTDGGAAGDLGGSDGIGVGVAKANDESGTYSVLSPSGVISTSINDKLLLCSIGYNQSGTTMNYDWDAASFGTGNAAFAFTVYDPPFRTSSSTTGGRVSKITIDPGKKTQGVAFGHVGVWADVPSSSDARIYCGYLGENGGARMVRLCAEEGVTLRLIGSTDTMPPMGEQTSKALTDLLQECADADHGMLFECRDAMSLCYRTRSSLYSQTTRLELDYDDGAVSDAIEPTDDDQQVRNDVTVSRDGGSSARVEKTTGRLSVNAPPDGVGRYQDSQSYNLWLDDDLEDHASWAVHLGTVDEARYPTLGIDYTNDGFNGDADMNEAGLMLDIGDRIALTNPPDSLPPDDVYQLAQGYGEAYGNFVHKQAFNCSPASPYDVATLTSARVDTSGSELADDYDTDDTSLSVTTTNGERWTTDTDYMPFDIIVGGEQMTVTAISGTTTTQTFTVTRSVNGVVKSQTSGTAVNIFNPTYTGL